MDDTNCKDTFCSQSPDEGSTAQRAKNNEFVESGLEAELSMSQVNNDHDGLADTGKHKTNSFRQKKVLLGQVRQMLFLFISPRLIQNYNPRVYSDFSFDYLLPPL